jgi:hypothetical protein
VAPDRLEAALDETWDVSRDRQDWILRMLPKVGDLISQLATARDQVLTRLDTIAALAESGGPVSPNGSIGANGPIGRDIT